MAHTVETETSYKEIDVVSEYDLMTPQKASVQASTAEGASPSALAVYLKVGSGMIAAVLLALVPSVTIPGSAVLVLICEVYLIDWLYSKYSQLGRGPSQPARIEAARIKYAEAKIDENAARPQPTDQLRR